MDDSNRSRWLESVVDLSGQAARTAGLAVGEYLHERQEFLLAAQRGLQELAQVIDSETNGKPALTLIRLGEVGRSQAFRWLSASLGLHERAARAPINRNTVVSADLARSLVIVTVAADIYSGYRLLRERQRRWPQLVDQRDWELQHERGARHFLDTALSLGGVLIKAGQLASCRPDLLPATYIQHLSRLQDRVPPLPWSTISDAMARELGARPEEVFARIDHQSLAAASLAQVHRAALPDGREVAVKVQYPGMRAVANADLAALERVASWIAMLEEGVRLQPIVDHLKATIPVELDFAHEGRVMTDLRARLAHREDVLIPEVIDDLSTSRLLVTEFVEGVKITDVDGLREAGIDPAEVARLLNDVYAEQLLQLNLVHADPHPGNLLVQPGPRLVILDHGLTLELSPALRDALAAMVRAIVSADFEALVDALRAAGLEIADDDLGSLFEVIGVIFGDESPDEGHDFGRNLTRNVGDIPVELITVGRAIGMLDGITRQLAPDLDALAILAGRL